MSRIFFIILGSAFLIESTFAAGVAGTPINTGISTRNSLFGNNSDWGLIDILSAIEQILLRVVLPLVIIGSTLYIAYQLFLAEGNEEKNKTAWKSLTFSIIGVLCIALAYAVVSIISRLSL